jgi:dienelactone hydrolase
MKTHKNGPRTISFLAGVLCLLIPISSNAFFGVNSLGEANDLKFKPGFTESTDYLSSNTTFERAKFSYEEVVVKATENVLEMDKDGNAEMVTREVETVERIPKPINYKEPKSPAVVLLHSCGGLGPKTSPDLNRWKNFLTANGYAVLVIDSLSARKIERGGNCSGRNRPVGKDRLVKDLFDAVAHLSAMPEIDSSRIFALGFSLGAMTAGISGDMADDRRYADKPHPRAVAGLYGGCRYRGGESWLPAKSAFPILWLMGSADLESPPADCLSPAKGLESQGTGSEWHIYENATHCWDCKAMDGLERVSGNGARNTYTFDENATRDSERRVLQFFEKFPTASSSK